MRMKWITHSFLLSLIWKVTYVSPLASRSSITEVLTATGETVVRSPERENSRNKRPDSYVQPQPIRTNSGQKGSRESFTVYHGGQKVTSKKQSPGRHWIGVGRKLGTAVSKQVGQAVSKAISTLKQKSSKTDREMSASKREPSIKRIDSSRSTSSCSSSSCSSSSSGTYSPNPGRESPGPESPGRKSPSKESLGRESRGRESPGRKSPSREIPGRESPSREIPGRESPSRESPGRESPPKTGEKSRPSKSFAATTLKMDDASWLAATKPKATDLSPSRTPEPPGQSSRRPASPTKTIEDPGQSSGKPESPAETFEDRAQRALAVKKTLVRRLPRSYSDKVKFLKGLRRTESRGDPSAVEVSRSESFRMESKERPVRERERWRSEMEIGRMNNVRAFVEDDPCNKWAPGIRTQLNIWCYRMVMELQSLPKDLKGRCHDSIYAECRPTTYWRSDGSVFEQYDCTMLDVLDKVLLNQKDVEEHNVWPKYKITRTDIVYFYECAKLTVEELYRTGKKAPPKLFFQDPRYNYRRDSDYESDGKRRWMGLSLPSLRLPSNLKVSQTVGVALKKVKGYSKWKKKHREGNSKEKSKPGGRSKEEEGSSSQRGGDSSDR